MAWTDASGTITTAQQSQKIYTAGTATGAIRFQNVSGSTVWLNSGAAASWAPGSFRLRVDDCIDETFLPVDADISIWGERGVEFTLKYN